MTKKWQELMDRTMSPERQRASKERAAAMLAELPLAEIRKARELTQQTLAAVMERDQASISTLERRTDAYVSTLRRYIQAMGGELVILARFPDGEVLINQFAEAE